MKRFAQLLLFCMAMGLLEAIIVVYMRELYYPEGFQFPPATLSPKILLIEYIREITTIIMLVSVGIIAGNSRLQGFSFFLYAFGIWDIFYYIGLKLFLNWPNSLLTWDILFLIPITWVGPVLAPILCSLGFIGISIFLEIYQSKGKLQKLNNREHTFLWSGALVITIAYVWDFANLIIKGGFLPRFFTLATDQDYQKIKASYIPEHFHWELFILGVLLVLWGLYMVYKRIQNSTAK